MTRILRFFLLLFLLLGVPGMAVASSSSNSNLSSDPSGPKPEGEEDSSNDSDENPNDETDDCPDDPDGSGGGCLNFQLSFPLLPLETGLGSQAFRINRNDPTPSLFTPQSLSYSSLALTYVFRITATENLPEGVSQEVQITDRKNVPVTFQVSTGDSIGKPVDRFRNRNERIQLLDAQKQPVTQDPAFYRLFLSSGGRIDYPAVRGATPAFYRNAHGRELDFDQLLGDELDLVTQSGTFRQIKSPVGLADIVVTGDFGYEIRLYTPENVGTRSQGLYTPQGEAYRTIRIENPTGDLNRSDTVRITDTHGAYSRSDVFTYVPAAEDWELTEGSGEHLRTEQLMIEEDPETGYEIKTRALRDHTNSLISKETLVIKSYSWGQAVIEKIEDPDGLAHKTTYDYYENAADTARFGRVRLVTRPDGSWTRYDYSSDGLVTQKVTPWLDSPPDAEPVEAVETLFQYTPVDSNDSLGLYDTRPRTVIKKTLGEETSRVYHAYVTDAVTGEYSEITETAGSPGAAYGAPGNHRTVRTYYASDEDFVRSGKLKSVLNPDQTLRQYDYEEGELEGETVWLETTTTFALQGGAPTLVDGESTRTIRTRDLRGNTIREETEVYDQAAWHTIGVQTQTYSNEITEGRNQLLTRVQDGVERLTQTWEGPLVTSRVDEQGITTLFLYDSLDRLEYEILHPESSNPITTYYDRSLGAISCGCDGARTVTRSAGGLSLETRQTTDAVGRRSEVENEVGAITSFSYQNGGRITTRTNPDGSTVITETYRDGRTKSVTGTGTVHRFHEYGVNSDGTRWTQVYSGPDGQTSPRWRKTTTNMLGQTLTSEETGYNGSTLVTTMEYDDAGRLVKSTPPAGAATHYEYNALSERIRSWQDINDNDALDLSGPDRISETETDYVQLNGEWYRESCSYTYNEGESTPTLVSTSRQRLTGLGANVPGKGLLVAESTSIDIHGNETVNRRFVDRANQTVYQETLSPFSNQEAVTRIVNGVVTEQTSTTGITTTFDYDALQRRVGQTDPRTGRSFVTYDATTGLVTKQTDADGNETLFGYDDTGRRISVTDPEGNTTYTAYTEDGQVRAKWGAAYPVVYEYDAFDRMVKLHTLRDPNITFNPTVNTNGVLDLSSISTLLSSDTDVTTWVYEPASGLLEEKLYDDGKGPAYTYTPDGRLLTREWVRTTDTGQPPTATRITTTYAYDSDTLELLSMGYSDGTPTVTHEYDRLGRQTKTTDAFGERTFSYNDALQPLVEAWESTDQEINDSLTRTYDAQGRSSGLELASGYQVAYAYSDKGRFDALTYTNTVNTVTHTADYAYVPDGELVAGYDLGDFSREVDYESNRNLVDTVTNRVESTVISAFEYTNDAAGRRTGRDDTGTAFSSTQANTFGYNSRNEVTSASMRNGTSSYSFDQIGNRIEVDTPDEPQPVSYVANALNQYDSVTSASSVVEPDFDADGNLTYDGENWRFEWNGENRMTEVRDYDTTPVDGSTRIHNTYDSQGRRVRKRVEEYDQPTDTWTATSDLRYLYDGWNLLYEMDVLSSAPSRRYVWGLDLSQSIQGAGGVGGLVLTESNGTTHAVSYDANGNISEYIDLADGSVDTHLEYDAFGRVIASTGTAPSNFGFSTKYADVETGYLYYGFRYYDPETGRWPNRDPIGERGGVNLYAFVGNDGVNSWDLFGLEQKKAWIIWYGGQGQGAPGASNDGMRHEYEITFDVEKSCDGTNPTIEISNVEGNLLGELDSFALGPVGGEFSLSYDTSSTSSAADCSEDGETGNKQTVEVTFDLTLTIGVTLGIGPFGLPVWGFDSEEESTSVTIEHSCCDCE